MGKYVLTKGLIIINNVEKNEGLETNHLELTEKLSNLFKKILNEKSIPSLVNAVNKNLIDKITGYFTNILQKLSITENITCVIDYEKTTSMILNDFFRFEQEPETNTNIEKGVNDQNLEDIDELEELDNLDDVESEIGKPLVNAKPVLSPVKGRDIESVEVGDEIQAVINDSSELASRIVANMKLHQQGRIKAIPVTVINKLRVDHNVYLYCNHAKATDVAFKVVEHIGIRIMVKDDSIREDKVQVPQDEKKVKKLTLFAAGIIIGVIAGIIIALFAIF